jgi:predicted ABC-type exoprotein transport system permease subunit
MRKLICEEPEQLDFVQNCEIEEHQAYKILKLLAQKTFFSHAFSSVKARAVSRVIVSIHKSSDRISVRFKRFHIRSSSIVGIFILLPNLSVVLGSWRRSQRVASTKFTTEKFKFITRWFCVFIR